MSDRPIWQWTAVETAAAIKNHAATSQQVTAAHVKRMREANPGVNAVVLDMGDEAMEQARACDSAVNAGAVLGPLHGVPVTVKQNTDYAGKPNPNGVPALKDVIAPADAPVIANLRKAGAVFLGQTNTPEFSMRGFTDNPLHGLTLNPWSDDITCGGSSGGAGSAVALGIGTIGHGNDIGGSLRWPAYCNGVATVKPTLGRVPAFNPSLTSERPYMAQLYSVQGPLARTVADVRLALEVMSAFDARDPNWVPAPLTFADSEQPTMVAVAKVPDDMACDPKVIAEIDKAAGWLDDAGYKLVEAEVPDIDRVWQLWGETVLAEMRTLQEDGMFAVASEDFKQVWNGFKRFTDEPTIDGFMRACAERNAMLRQWLIFHQTYPLVLAPASTMPVPGPRADIADENAPYEIFFRQIRFITALNVLGLPIASVPTGLVNDTPCGVQLIGSRYREDLCLRAAEVIEARAGILAETLWCREHR